MALSVIAPQVYYFYWWPTIERGSKKGVTITDNELKVRYTYEFLGGKRKGAKLVTFTVPETTDTLNLTFSWHDKWHVITDKANPKIDYSPLVYQKSL